MKKISLIIIVLASLFSSEVAAQVQVYRSGGGEIILSGANVRYSGPVNTAELSTNPRFTLFFHTQQMLNIDFTGYLGLYTGAAIRNVGLIMEDQYRYLGFTDIPEEMMDQNAKVKRRSYSLGFPLAIKVGSFGKNLFLYAGGEYEWMFHYKQKLFLDGEKVGKEREWASDRVNAWNPSLFAGIQFPGGLNLKFKYYMKDFLNHSFSGEDFGRPVDYSRFESSGIWYVSLALVISKKQLKKIMKSPGIGSQSANL